MDRFQLLASIIDSLAWPLTVGMAVYWLRKPLVELLPKILRFKYKDLEIMFGERLERLERELEQGPPPEHVAPLSDEQRLLNERFESLLNLSPEAAILDAWIEIERAVHELAVRQNVNLSRGSSFLYITRLLSARGVISNRLARMLDELRNLRNAASHPTVDQLITVSGARRYKEIADQVRDELQLLLV